MSCIGVEAWEGCGGGEDLQLAACQIILMSNSHVNHMQSVLFYGMLLYLNIVRFFRYC